MIPCLRNEGVVNEDRISQLPEALILQILSSLDPKDVVATSVLSKEWKSRWKYVPKIKFDYGDIQTQSKTFSEIVCKVLLANKSPVLESFYIYPTLEDFDAMDIGMWVGMAYARGVRKLVINVASEKGCFKFPKSFYNCETLETLELGAWVNVHVPSQVCLKSLRTLHLCYVDYEDEESIVNFLSGCPNLENLVVRQSDSGVEVFTIAAPSLQSLTIHDDNDDDDYDNLEGYVINTPSLKYLKIERLTGLQFCVIENAPELVEAHIRDVSKITNENILRSLTSVKRLTLVLSPLEIKFPTGSIFYQLVYLELSTHKAEWWNLLLLMLSSSPKLQVLKLIDAHRYTSKYWCDEDHVVYGRWSQPKNVPECLLFCLETFVWKSYNRCVEEETNVAKYILGNANRLKRATFSPKPFGNTLMVEQLETVIRAANSCQLVFE